MDFYFAPVFLLVLVLPIMDIKCESTKSSTVGERPLVGSAGVLLRDILFGATEPGEGPRAEARRSKKRRKGKNRRGNDPDLILNSDSRTPDVSELLAALESHGMDPQEGQSPAAQYILQLYERLQHGESLPEASGHKGRPGNLRHADTVRTFTASGKNNFYN